MSTLSSTSDRSWLKRNDLAVFLILAFSLSWWPWGFTLLNPDSAPMVPFGPIIAAFIVTAMTTGWAGVKSLMKNMVRWRVGVRWYVVALLLPVGVVLAALYLNVLFGAPAPTAADLANWYLILLAFPGQTLVAGAFTEEPGWRGFALPRLQARYSPLVASLILGVIWASWHLPLLVSDTSGQRPPIPYFLTVLALSVLLAWLYNGTKGSVFLAILMHGAFNTVGAFFLPIQFGAAYGRLWWLQTALWWTVAIVVIVRTAMNRTPRAAAAQTAMT